MIIVTGAAGFIGSRIVHALNRHGEKELILVDRFLKDLRWKNLLGARYKEIITPDELPLFIKSHAPLIKSIIHMGAISSTTWSDVDELMGENYRTTLDLFYLALEKEIPFIYASSCSVYGDGSCGFDDTPEKIFDFRPLNAYAFSKYAVDHHLVSKGLHNKALGLRFSNVFGPGESHKGDMASVLYKKYHQIQKEGRATLFASSVTGVADGEQKRDFVFGDDVAETIALLRHGEVKGIYNLGSGLSSTFKSLVERLFLALGKKPVIEYVAMPEKLASQYQSYTRASPERLFLAMEAAKLQKPHQTPFEEAIESYVKWMMKNESL